MLPVGAMPRLPASAAARSLRMSACRLVATMVSSEAGRLIMRAVDRVDQFLVPVDVGELLRDLQRDLVPHHHRVALRVALGDDGQQLARPRLRQLEREAHDALDAGAGHHRDVGGGLDRVALVDAAADAGVLAFGVLAHDDPVQVVRAAALERPVDARAGCASAARWRTGRSPGRSSGAGPTA